MYSNDTIVLIDLIGTWSEAGLLAPAPESTLYYAKIVTLYRMAYPDAGESIDPSPKESKMSDSCSWFNRISFKPLARRIGLVAMIGLIAASTLASFDAESQRRMGGGRSIGRQSQSAQNQSTPPAQQPTPQQGTQAQRAQPAPAPAAAATRSRWLGPIAGLAAGLGIAALLSHLGLGEAFSGALANIIVIALVAMAGIWLIRKFLARRRPQDMSAHGAAGQASMNTGGYAQDTRYPVSSSGSGLPSQDEASSMTGVSAVPAGFDTEAFLRSAKVCFIRLQAAWDEGNLADIREFSTPEMFAEVKVDLDARGAERSQTDVVQLNADLLSVDDRGKEYFASVRFQGLIREAVGSSAEPFVEIWNLSKSTAPDQGWLLAGIQQIRAD